jgi:hypothetical protein
MSGVFLYRHPWLYRLSMLLLYGRDAALRRERVCACLRPDDRVVLELCFGDVALAAACRRRARRWIGLDNSRAFVAHARRRHFDARLADVRRSMPLPRCDVCVMMGSLYQFRHTLAGLFLRIRACSGRLILSEPVQNWVHAGGWRRRLAWRLTRASPLEEPFRFDAGSLPETLRALQEEVGFDYRVVHSARDMLVEVTWSK